MKKRTIGILSTVSAAAICLGALSGAYAAEQNDTSVPEGFLTAEQTLAEFGALGEVTGLTLPDGIEWPKTPPTSLNDLEGAFEKGYMESVGNLYWLCAWEDTLVDAEAARGAEVETESIEAVTSFDETDWFADNYVDQVEPWGARVAAPAAEGDLSGVKADLATCGYFYENQ